MDGVKATLSRKVGPFTVGAWLLVIIAGVALGLIIRRRLGGIKESEKDYTGTSLPSNPYGQNLDGLPNSQGAPTILQQDFETVTAIREEQDRFRDESESRWGDIEEMLGDFFTSVDERVDEINLPAEPVPVAPKEPTTVTPTPVAVVDDLQPIRNAILNIFAEEGLPPPDANRLDRLAIEVTQGRTLASIRAGLETYKSNRPELGIPV